MNSEKKKKFWSVLTLLSPPISDLKGCFNSDNSLINVGFFLPYSGRYDLYRAEEGANRIGRAGTDEEAV